ncbi:MAG: glycosyltransferase family 2 protein [Clostridium sp.]|nr:glycosyltransferase family 2 protein [Clostridium sp.]
MKYKHVFSICAYKDSPYLERCIRSLKAQSLPGHMILCTSTPSPYIDGLAWKYGIPLYVRDGESNIRDDWNFAYEMADGELVTIAHQDDMYHREYSAQLLEAYGRYPDMTVFTTDYAIIKNGRLITGDKMLWIKRLLRIPLRMPCLNGLTWVKRLYLILGNPICCPATTYQKKMLGVPLVRSGFQFALDWDNLYKLAGERGRFICVERPLLYYRVHEGATTKACIADNRRQMEEEIMFRRFWPEPVARLLMHFYKSAYAEYE